MYNPDPSQFPPGGFSPGYGGPPPPSSGTPPVVTWFKVYAGLMTLLYLLLMGTGIFLVVAGANIENELPNGMEPVVLGSIYGIMGLIFSVVYAFGLFLPRKPWGWIVGIVLIALGMTSLCCLPATIPLLIFWLKPEAKAYFGRT